MPISEQVLKKYRTDIFVETGTGRGNGVAAAIESGFKEIYSIEVNNDNFVISSERFKNNKNVHLFKGDSMVILPQVLSSVNKSATFWLDAHTDTKWNDVLGKKGCPILEEIDEIINSHIFEKVILIDDIRLFKGQGQDFWNHITDKDILSLFSRYGHYNVAYEDGFVKDDIMVVDMRSKK